MTYAMCVERIDLDEQALDLASLREGIHLSFRGL